MTTRLYFSLDSLAAIAPSSWSTGWNKTSGTAANRELTLQNNVDTSALVLITNTGVGTSGQFTAIFRNISPSLKAQTISGSLKGQFVAFENAAGDNYTLAVAVKVIKADGTDRGILLAVSASDDTSTTPPENATSNTNRHIRDAAEATSLSLSSLAVSDGDRIVVELGFRQASTSTNVGGVMRGRGTGIDTDLPENESTANGIGWVEFSNNVLFDPIYFKSASTPVDGASTTNTADPTVVTPPVGMLAGDLVCMIGQRRAAGDTIAVSEAGGQTWTSHTAISTTNQTARLFTCTFNGTWGANPSVDFSGGTCTSVHMHVFRPPATNYTWSVNQALVELDASGNTIVTITGQTTTGSNPTVTLAGWFSADDNTWGNLGAAGWQVTGSAQYRNTSGSDQSATYAHKIQTAAGATGNVSKEQLTLGDDAATTFIVTMEAVSGSLALTPSLFSNTQTYNTQVVTPGAVTLTPSLFSNTQTYFTHVVAAAAQPLTPSLFTNTQTFNTHALTVGAVNLTSSLFSNSQTFNTHTLTRGAVNLAASLFNNSQTFYLHTLSLRLNANLFSNSQAFNTHILTSGAVTLSHSLFSNAQTYYTHLGAQVLTGTLFSNSQTFNAHALTKGAVNLSASLFTNAQTYVSHTLTVGTVNLVPSLFSNTQTFNTHTLDAGSGTQDLTPALFSNAQTFNTHVLAFGQSLTASLFTNTQTFHTCLLTCPGALSVPLIQNETLIIQSVENSFERLGDLEDGAVATQFLSSVVVRNISIEPWKEGNPEDGLFLELRTYTTLPNDGTLIAVSNVVSAEDITAVDFSETVEVPFLFSSFPHLDAISNYCIVIRRTGDLDNDNCYNIKTGFDSNYPGDFFLFKVGIDNWQEKTSTDLRFNVETFFSIHFYTHALIQQGRLIQDERFNNTQTYYTAIGPSGVTVPLLPQIIHQKTEAFVFALGLNGSGARLAQAITVTAPVTVEHVTLKLQRQGDPIDGIVIEIRSYTTLPDDGALIATSDEILGSSLTTSMQEYVFNFSSPPTLLNNGTKYALIFRRTGTLETSNYYFTFVSASANSYPNNKAWFFKQDTLVWFQGEFDFWFIVSDGTFEQTFYTPQISLTIRPDLFTNDQTYFTFKSTYQLSANLFTNTQTYFTQILTALLAPSLYTNAQIFFTPKVSHVLSASLYTNAQTFNTHKVTIALTAALYTNTQTFFTQAIAVTSPLVPSLYTNTQTFNTHAITIGTVNLTPVLFSNSQTFNAHTIGGLSSTFENIQTFYSHAISHGLNSTRFDNTQTFFDQELIGPKYFELDTLVENYQEWPHHVITQNQRMRTFQMRVRRGRM